MLYLEARHALCGSTSIEYYLYHPRPPMQGDELVKSGYSMPTTDTAPATLVCEQTAAAVSRAGADTPRFYRPELDALRFVAFLCVFACHALPFPGSGHATSFEGPAWRLMQTIRESGNFGVSLFFVLSAYLITELLRREKLATSDINLKAFYVRRILRIWPLYFFMLLLCWVLGPFVSFLHMEPGQVLANLFFYGNWYIAAHFGSALALSYLWSISVEEQFYIAWPSIVKFADRTRASPLLVPGACIPLTLAAIAILTQHRQHLDVTVWLNSVVQFQFFALGAIFAFALRGEAPKISRRTRIALWIGGAGSWIVASGVCRIKSPNAEVGPLRMCVGFELVALGCTLFFFGVLGIATKYVPKPARYLGKISYGLYIFHGIALFITAALRKAAEHGDGSSLLVFASDRVLALVLTILLAALSYKYLETPFLKLKDRFALIESRAI
jgi:peptidoglycan/LPS O-acetylase OafA/YrhL